jgi:3-oxoacyl-[acyl-carrier protein] reductase
VTVRVAVVTGGSRGIGRQVALRLAADGHAVAIGYARDDQAAQETVDAIEQAEGSAVALAGDLAQPGEAGKLFELAEERFGGVDVVVHAAGMMYPPTPVADIDLELLARVYGVNVLGTFAVLQEAARRVRSGGAIVTLSSSAIGLALPGYSAYVSSKAAVGATSLILARELRGRDITVNAVAPGPTATEFFMAGKDQATIDGFARQPPLERLGTPDDVAEVVAFLAGPARWINGQTVRANGGIV